jgi:hypothetical protein
MPRTPDRVPISFRVIEPEWQQSKIAVYIAFVFNIKIVRKHAQCYRLLLGLVERTGLLR